MLDAVCIVGAGWKCGMLEIRAAPSNIPFRCPELLFPLGKDQTVLSRLVKQFRTMGAKTFLVGVGNPDNCPTEPREDHLRKLYGVPCSGYGQPPWTHERVEQVRQAGAEPILIDDPLRFSGWTTYQIVFEKCRERGDWKKLVGISGDYVFQTDFLKSIVVQAGYPSLCWLEPRHEMLFLDRPGLDAFLEFMYTHRNANRQDGLGGGCVWKDRQRMEREFGVRGWTPGWFETYMAKTHRSDEFARFQEIGVHPRDWHRACVIEKNDPI